MTFKAGDVQWFRSIWFSHRVVCLWWAILPSGSLHIPQELVREGALISEFCRDVRLLTKKLHIYEAPTEYEHHPYIRYTVALQEQMQGRVSRGDDGETRADTFRHNGIIVREQSHDEAQGWTRVAELLGALPDGRPLLTIAPSCVQLIRSITNAVSDPDNPEILLESPNDQPLRCLRVGAMSRPAPKPFAPPPLPKHAVGHLVNEIRALATGEDE